MTVMKRPRVIRRTTAHFPVRRIGNDYSGAPSDRIVTGQPAVSQMFAGFSMFFPPGERFMIRAVRSIVDQIKDPELAADLDAFVRQEAQHAAEHNLANMQLAAAAGGDPDRLTRELIAVWDLIERVCTPRQRVAFTAAVEHFTALIGEVALMDIELIQEAHEDKLQQLLVWHGIEECEHKAVAFDAFKEIGGTEVERILAMLVFTGPGVATAFLPVLRLIVAHGELPNLKSWAGFVRVVGLRWGPHALRSYLAWYRPGFHPNHLPTRHIEQYWRAQLGADLPVAAA